MSEGGLRIKRKKRTGSWQGMTAAEKYGYIKNNILRRYFRQWWAYGAALDKAKRKRVVPTVSGLGTKVEVWYECAECGDEYRSKDVCVDHRSSVIGVEGWTGDWNPVVEGMFCDVDNLQVLCNYAGEREENGTVYRACHYFKSQEERKARAEYKKAKKEKV